MTADGQHLVFDAYFLFTLKGKYALFSNQTSSQHLVQLFVKYLFYIFWMKIVNKTDANLKLISVCFCFCDILIANICSIIFMGDKSE